MFYDNFRRICKTKGTSPTAVLHACGFLSSKLGTWSRGGLPKEGTLQTLANYLGCNVSDFFKKEDEWLNASDFAPRNEDEEELIEFYRHLSRQGKHQFMSMFYDYKDSLESTEDKK